MHAKKCAPWHYFIAARALVEACTPTDDRPKKGAMLVFTFTFLLRLACNLYWVEIRHVPRKLDIQHRNSESKHKLQESRVDFLARQH